MVVAPTLEKKLIKLIVSLALFMDALDATIINTAIPAMSRSLQVNPVDLKIALISYLLSLAIFIPISGWIGDKYGIKRVFISALTIFTLSSIVCGNAHNLTELVIARSVQGLGGALMLPLGRLIILRTFERHEIVNAMTSVIMVVSFGLMLGPFAGGLITDHLSWHWIFWVNIPVGVLSIFAASLWLRKDEGRQVKPFDLLGFLLFGGGLAIFTFSLSELSESRVNLHLILFVMLVAILMLIGYFLHSKNRPNSVINTQLFQTRTFRVSTFGNLVTRLGIGAIPFLLPLILQEGLGYSAQLSGLLLVPIALGIIIVKPLSLGILRKFGYKNFLILNTLLMALSLWSFQLITPHIPAYVIAGLTLIFGTIMTLQYSGMNSLAYADVSNEDLSEATSIISTVQQLGQSFGVATGALGLRFFSGNYTEHFKIAIPIFHQTFLALGILTLLSAVIYLQLKPSDGHQMLSTPP